MTYFRFSTRLKNFCMLFTAVFIAFSFFQPTKLYGQVSYDSNSIKLSNLHKIQLSYGINNGPQFDSETKIQIIKAYFEDAGTASHDHFLVMTQNDRGSGVWNIAPVGLDANPGIDDIPDEGDDTVKSVQFFIGQLNDNLSILLIVGTRNINADIRIPSRVNIQIYKLQNYPYPAIPAPGFKLISDFTTPKKYFSADMAITDEISAK